MGPFLIEKVVVLGKLLAGRPSSHDEQTFIESLFTQGKEIVFLLPPAVDVLVFLIERAERELE